MGLKHLRVMVSMILNSLLQLTWLIVILGLVLYVFGILFTSGATDYRKPTDGRPVPENAGAVNEDYGSLFLTMFTLFLSVTGGVSWGEVAVTVRHAGFLYFMLFICYIFLTLFSILNVVTGVFVDGAIAHAHADRQLALGREREKKSEKIKELVEMLGSIDTDGSGTISWDEFKTGISRPDIRQAIESMMIDIHEAPELFELLDLDGDGDVDILEFIEVMQRLEGNARSSDIQKLKCASRQVLNAVMVSHDLLYQVICDLDVVRISAEGERTYNKNLMIPDDFRRWL